MSELNFACVVGARPNFMKMAPILRALEAYPEVSTTLIHTGQHYDANLSDIFFEELEIKRPEICLEVGSGSHGVQTARILEKMEQILQKGTPEGKKFDRVIVVGDVNSTMAATLAAVKLGIFVAHVEAGLRSFDRTMPEEINRLVTDSISDMLLVSEPAGIRNLQNEGRRDNHIHLVGNVMIDTLFKLLSRAQKQPILREAALIPQEYGVITLHRPSNVDEANTLESLIDVLIETSRNLPMAFPMHPRTKARINEFGLKDKLASASGILLLPPLGYLDFLCLTSQAKVIVTDSGGLQEESTALNVPCLTMRSNTERPITVDEGSSTLIGNDAMLLSQQLGRVLGGSYKKSSSPKLWDGHAAERIAELLVQKQVSKDTAYCDKIV